MGRALKLSGADKTQVGAFEVNYTPGLMKGEMRFRVYPSAGAFFFIKVDDVAKPIMHGALWVMIARAMEKSREKKRESYRGQLDAMSIKDRVESNPNNFRIPYAEVEESKIEQPSFLGLSMNSTPTWKVSHMGEDGKKKTRTFILPRNQDSLAGMPLVESVLPNKHQNLIYWDAKKKKFRKVKNGASANV